MEYKLPCEKCSGTGMVDVSLFYSVVKDPCTLCKGTGRKFIPCPSCKQYAATITINFDGDHRIGDCSFCFLKNLQDANNDDDSTNPQDPFYGCFT